MIPDRKPLPSHARVLELLAYNAATGTFTWKRTVNSRAPAGAVAGHKDKADGYIVIRIDGTAIRAHRLAIFHATGSWPPALTDHRNRNRADNRLRNLRAADAVVNAANRPRMKRPKRGVKGLYHRSGAWFFRTNGRIKRFDTLLDAGAWVIKHRP